VAPGADPARLQSLREVAPGVEIVGAANEEEAAAAAVGADVVIAYCTPAVVAKAKDLRWIQVMSAGVERCVSIPEVRERKPLITNMQRVTGPVIAEHVIGMVLALNRGFPSYLAKQPAGDWDPEAAGDLRVTRGKTMLVVGLGGIGTEVARRAHALGMRVVATRASGKAGPDFVAYVGGPDELLKLAAEADVVVNALPLTPATTNIFDAKFFAGVKPGATFVSVGRGKSTVTAALVAALREGKLAGAGLDVTEPEPLPKDHPLWRLPNVIVTPHVAAQSDLGREAQWRIVRENLRRYVAGDAMLSVVDVERGY
jgi:phosphoglycerate dehydrogenase-like enzyme